MSNLFTTDKENEPQINLDWPLFEAICELVGVPPLDKHGNRNTRSIGSQCRRVLWGAVKASKSNGQTPSFDAPDVSQEDLDAAVVLVRAARGRLSQVVPQLDEILTKLGDLDLDSL